MTCLSPPCKRTTPLPLGFGSSTPRSKQITAGIPFIKSRAITKAVSPKFSTAERIKNRRPLARILPKKTGLQMESDLIKSWFTAAFEEKLQEDPYISSKFDKNHPILSVEEFQIRVLEKNLRSVAAEKKVKSDIQADNYHISAPILRQVFRVHKAMFELREQGKVVVLKAAPGVEVANNRTKYSCVLFESL